MSDSAKKRSLLIGASLGVAGTLALVIALGLAAGAGATAGATPPSNTSPPTISGTAQKGQRLHAEPGSWSGTKPMTFGYQWQRCSASGANCSNISGAANNDYTLTSADVGNTARVVVTAKNSAGMSTAASSPTAVVAALQAPANTTPPSITGAAQLGQTLTANPGSWTGPQPIAFTFQWLRCDQIRRQLREHRRRNEPDATADLGRRRPRAARPGAGKEHVGLDLGDVGAHRRRVRDGERLPDRRQGRHDRADRPAGPARDRHDAVHAVRPAAQLT
jgi:hypothetical protein